MGHGELRLARVASSREVQRNAVTPVMSYHRTFRDTDDLPEVVVEQHAVASDGVLFALRLVGEAEAGEVHDAHSTLAAEQRSDVIPVDAARRKAVDEQHNGRVRVTDLGMKDLQLVPVA